MAAATPLRPPPTSGEDRRWRMVDSSMRRGGNRPDSLIEVLHTVQELFGYLDRDALAYVGAGLGVPKSRVFGVATFYSFFTLRPPGEHTCVVCTGTACHLAGAPGLVVRVEQLEGAVPGETTADGRLSVLTARCVGACTMAPVVVVDGRINGHVTPDRLESLLVGL